ncbi:glycerate kinase [Clostridium pasteurianum DSM 525 = ATCC 6013]|uniref:Glycerate kinase n=1 Tax=Clostridium pasteurianum DSM 525 = ATCC 6013 TaxID=1262449 RepID=A0A0H3J9W3_CLOPA|nr:glycerate kinase [Clostridium pasteurianum]AJA49028.1 glycerate kinase [Clostridium pasteurianum DSM 525 = ATCC 6013]AJA53016.1 glycerate kinase [Clostridium pasteurianum DSM 525 = ATCC 6013]AOZ76233.1 glycerate kinase [Clostridium pasteurianum DSM 525 = ATCC 6013]AOZ80029.1 glycerate kinase [Clostridium pasteurianum]ELP60324.1 glycerate kinase [Clostridium pasteurianum DSM 525 = ATCC 6013]
MKIVIAPDSYKGSLSALEVANNIEKGIRRIFNNLTIEKIPMADGGEGTVQSLVDSTNGKIVNVIVKGPLGKDVTAFYGILGDAKTAIIEMAAASGLPLIPKEEKNPLITTSYGTGQLIKDALDKDCKNIIIGLGGSATNDGGVGAAKALGVKFLDKEGNNIGEGGGAVGKLNSIDISNIDPRIKDCNITAACDVDNPLCGPKGASHVFGPQKGADSSMIEFLDKNLSHYAEIIKRDLSIDIINTPGAGAAGGLGAGIMAFLNASMKRGIDIVIELTDLEQKIKDADLVFTGEGMIDFQTAFGKAPFGVAKIAKKYDIPVIAIAGGIGKDAETLYLKGFDSIFSIVDGPMTLDNAIENSSILIERTAERIARVFKACSYKNI